MKKIVIVNVEGPQESYQAYRILKERAAEIDFNDDFEYERLYVFFEKQKQDGFTLNIKENIAFIKAPITREYIACAGKLLELLYEYRMEKKFVNYYEYSETPKIDIRYHYMPAHFGNAFECASISEMRRFIEDMALAGATGYGDWFDPSDMPDPYNPEVFCSISMSLWTQKKEYLKISKSLGLDNMLCVAHNIGFIDQLKPEIKGIRSHKHKVQGQVICTSTEEGRKLCLYNQENLFADLVKSGVIIDKVFYNPYDDGGCACDKCQPYYPTFLRMVSQIHDVVRRYYPNALFDLSGWWVSDEEMELVYEFAKDKDYFNTFQYSATYDVFELPKLKNKLRDIKLSTFFHIGFSHYRDDVYMKSGIHSAPDRIQSNIKSYERENCLGFHTYNESFGDHLNIYLSTKLARNPDEDTSVLIKNYCCRMFSLYGDDLDKVANILTEMQYLDKTKAKEWYDELIRIKPGVKVPPLQNWAYEHVIVKAKILMLNNIIGDGENWEQKTDLDEVLEHIHDALGTIEYEYRECYRMGIMRHCFIKRNMYPPWYKNYIKFYPESNGNITPGMSMNNDA